MRGLLGHPWEKRETDGGNKMLDLLFIVEVTWCTLWILFQGPERALLYSGAVITSGFVASQTSGWLSKVLLPTTSSVFSWIVTHVSMSDSAISVLSGFVPAEPVMAGGAHPQWIAYHIVKIMFFISITLAVFLLFVVIAQLSKALWDGDGRERTLTLGLRMLTLGLSVGTALYAGVLTANLVANAAWLQTFSGLAHPAATSMWMVWSMHITQHIIQLVSRG